MKLFLSFLLICISTFSFGQIVNIPDANFKNALVNHDPVIDTNGDEEIQVSEAEDFSGYMDVSSQGISSLTGIEAFENIIGLDCSSNSSLSQLNLSQNTELTTLVCNNMSLNALDLSNNPLLTYLNCSYNSIDELDLSHNTSLIHLESVHSHLNQLTLPQSTALETVTLFANNLQELDVSGNVALTKLVCSVNQLNGIDLTQNTNLTSLWLAGNSNISSLDISQNVALDSISLQAASSLSELDVTQNLDLVYLRSDGTALTELDISQNTVLSYLNVNQNQLSELDASQNAELYDLVIAGNMLTALNVANGNNENLFLYAFDNPDLNCIQVDSDIVNNIPEDWGYDPGVTFSEDCSLSVSEDSNTAVSLYPNPTTDDVYINLENSTSELSYRVYSLTGKLIFKGIGNQISLGNISAGMYLVTIKVGNVMSIQRVIKE